MSKQHATLEDILETARKILQPQIPLDAETRKILVDKANVFDEPLSNFGSTCRSEFLSFRYFLEGTHPIFDSPRFLTVAEYNPLNRQLYEKNHKIAGHDEDSNRHGNNYTYTATNLRNGILFTYHDIETDSYIPVTFNTNAPICMVAPDPHCIHGNDAEVIGRMLMFIRKYSSGHDLKNFPLVFKGLPNGIIHSIPSNLNPVVIAHDSDITTITAEMNFSAVSYNILKLMEIANGEIYFKKTERPKLRSAVKKNDKKVYFEDWDFNAVEANYIAHKWASSKCARLRNRGVKDGGTSYFANTIVDSISIPPPGEQNVDYFALAVRASYDQAGAATGEILGVVMASRCSHTIVGLNAVVVPVHPNFRDLGYYAVYKLAEKMFQCGIIAYWHGPKESECDVKAVEEFMGKPDDRIKRYCLQFSV